MADDLVEWHPEFSPEGQAYVEELRSTYTPLIKAHHTIRQHLNLNEITAFDLSTKHLRPESEKRVVDLKQINDLVKQGNGMLTFTLQNEKGEVIDLASLFGLN
jgi:hypothetical protein